MTHRFFFWLCSLPKNYINCTTQQLTTTYLAHSRWNPPWRDEWAYLTKRFQPSASIRRACRSDAAMFYQNKQIFLSTFPRTGFSTKVWSYLGFSKSDCNPSYEWPFWKQIGLRCSVTEGDAYWMVNDDPMFWKWGVH